LKPLDLVGRSLAVVTAVIVPTVVTSS